jgi:hypothetical protein
MTQEDRTMDPAKSKRLLLRTHVIPLGFWAFDVITTLYAINILGVAGELNPLGWPWGAWGALTFYVPAVIFPYVLLFRMENRFAVWSATVITLIAVGFGAMNLLAALHNIQVALTFL